MTERVLALDPARISADEVSSVLSRCPAPRIYAFNGTAFNTMDSFSKFLTGMGYPESSVRDPESGAWSYSGYLSPDRVIDKIRHSIETEKMRPMLIGHSRGGALVMKTLRELGEGDLRLGFAAAIATGKWMRFVTGQWDQLATLRKVPDSVDEFSGYSLAGDWIGSDLPLLREAGEYEPEGAARVRNIRLSGAGHLEITRIDGLPSDPAARARIETGSPDADAPSGDAKLIFAADIWYHVKKHWCLELKRLVKDAR